MLQESILQYFPPSLSYHFSLSSLFCLFYWPFYTSFTVYYKAQTSLHTQAVWSSPLLYTPCRVKLGDICILNFYLGRYIAGYTLRNLVLRRHVSGAVKCDFGMYIRRYTSLNESFEYGYPHSNALVTFFLSKRQWNCSLLCLRIGAASCIKLLASCIKPLVSQWKATLQDILSQIYDVIQSDVG